MTTRIAVNGFGRIGRCFLRSATERSAGVEIAAVNDIADAGTLAALLARDSVYGPFPGDVSATADAIVIDGREIPVFAERDPAALPWADLGIDVVIEATGKFRTRAGAATHLDAGARKVIITAPAKGDE